MSRRTSLESRQNILEAASRVFSERGYFGAAIREVAREAGISVGGIYLYYRNKEELYSALFRDEINSFLRHTETLRDKPPLVALKSLMDSYMNYAVKRTKLVSMHIKQYDLELKKPLKKAFFLSQRKLVADILRKGVEQGIFKGIKCEDTADIILLTLRGAILAHLSGEVRSMKKCGDLLYEVILNGIGEKADAD
jgi:AcrR family transcriptional regulator